MPYEASSGVRIVHPNRSKDINEFVLPGETDTTSTDERKNVSPDQRNELSKRRVRVDLAHLFETGEFHD